MNEALPSLDDPLVRTMADRNHVPIEVWTHGGGVTLSCRQDGYTWPCATRQAIDIQARTDALTAP